MKKYASLVGELRELEDELRAHPTKGTPIGHSCYKIRLAVKAKGKGKSGGARVITYYYVRGSTVYLLSIYDKVEQENISAEKIAELLQGIKDL
ncbi:MAG: type II toxin-antitoxin system RelE/ParE family toxin [Planctomycetaceae bacterium]|nr:type II toxin-antitoxin system RelE/ParE family toxin [Planctomycetaceae bacterium]